MTLSACFGFASALGSAVTRSCIGFLEVGVVGIGDTVAICVGVFSVIGICWELIGVIGLAVTVGIGIVGIGSLGIFLGVGQAIAVRIGISVATVGWVEAVGDLPSIGKAVTIAVCIVHVGSLGLLLGIGKTIAVPVGTTVGRIQWIRTVGVGERGSDRQKCGDEQSSEGGHTAIFVIDC